MSLRQARISRVELSGLTGVNEAVGPSGKNVEGKGRSADTYRFAEPRGNFIRAALEKNHFVPFGDEFILHPGRFVIGTTLEWIRLPLNAGGYVTGKSSLGRHGLVIETAAAIHPRFTGCLALEIANVGEVPLVLRPGMPIAQLLLHQTTGEPQPAQSILNGRRKPYLPTPVADRTLKALSAAVRTV